MSDKILKFSASWCGPCKMLTKTIEGQELGLPLEEVDIDENQSLAVQYGIRSVPTMVYIRDGSEVSRVSGMMVLGKIQEWIASNK
jgi:thioredoxin 1